jgi:hypothetical protein
VDSTDSYRICHPQTAEFTFFSAAHRTFFKMHHILVDKVSLNKYKKTGITSCVFSDCNAIKLESITRETTERI